MELKDEQWLEQWDQFLWFGLFWVFFFFLFQGQVLPVTLLLNSTERRSAFPDHRLKSINTGVI